MKTSYAAACLLIVAACSHGPTPETSTSIAATSGETAHATTTPAAATPAPATTIASVQIGQPAPDFALQDVDGKTVKLSDFAGKVVVLEWFNPGCPFVKGAHSFGQLKTMAKDRAANGVVWLAIDSSAVGRQGSSVDEIKTARDSWGLSHPILLDRDGKVGKTYGATNTPHMFVVDTKGVLRYSGALDDSRGAEPDKDSHVVNYVGKALDALAAGKPVEPAQTKAWGCGVKYADR